MKRRRGFAAFESLRECLLEDSRGFSEELDTEDNVLLCDGEDCFLFEKDSDASYSAHFFLKNARGKRAIELSRQALHLMFGLYQAEVIKGLTPIELKPALQIIARLGFTNYGNILTPAGEARLSILTKKEYGE